MTEQIPSREAVSKGRLSAPERIGRAVGVALFWVPAVLFIVLSTYSVVGQVFMLASTSQHPHSAACEVALQQMAVNTSDVHSDYDVTREKWRVLFQGAETACGDDDPTIQEITAVLLRMQKRMARSETSFQRDRARLTRALAQYVAHDPPHHE